MWCLRFSEALEWSSERALRLAADLGRLQAKWTEELHPRARSALAKLLPLLPALPVLDVATAAKAVSVSDEAARLAILELESRGILRPTKVGKQRYRIWRAPDVLDVIEGAEDFLRTRGGQKEK